MKQRFLFLIRGKLGDTLVAYSVLREFLLRHPEHEVTLIARQNYLSLIAPPLGVRYELIPYRGRLECWWAVLRRRVLAGRWNVFAVLWGTGKNLAQLARVSGARRRLYLDGRYRDQFPEFPQPSPHTHQTDPAWRVARLLDPDLPKPSKLVLDALAQRWRSCPDKCAIGICPISDEKRRNFSSAALGQLLHALARRYPGQPLYVLLNPGDHWILPANAPPRMQPKYFRNLEDLVAIYLDLQAWYGTDTGLYHLAAGMGISCTEFFGPTVPGKNAMPEQDNRCVRLAVLEENHCEVKDCVTGDCLNRAIENFCGAMTIAPLASPDTCPLRAFNADQLSENASHESPDTQAR